MDDKQVPDTELGVSGFLPPMAAAILVRAASTARQYDEEELERVRTIERAIDEVQRRWPEFFTTEATARMPSHAAPFF